MPKLKTHKGTAKNHMLSKKSKSRKRRINTSATIEGSVAKNIKRALGVK